MRRSIVLLLAALLGLPLLALSPGCVLAPRDAAAEKQRLADSATSADYDTPFEGRALPDLPARPTWRDVLARALLADGDLESAHHAWAMAVSRIDQAGAWPNTPLAPSFEYMFSGERLSAWDRTTVGIGFDPMESLSFPTKTMASAKVAWRDAQAAGLRFAAAKFETQRRVLETWAEYALLAEQARIGRENLELLRLLTETAAGRVRAGGPQQDLLRSEVQLKLAEDALRTLEARLAATRASLNAMLARLADAPLEPPSSPESPRALPADDAVVLAVGVAGNAELAALAADRAGRGDALERARLEYIPDINPFGGWTGTLTQFAGIGLTLPTVLPRIRGAIDEARADLRRVEAMARQAANNRSAEFVAALVVLRNAERQERFFETDVRPLAQRALDNARQQYAAGTGTYLDLIDAQRTLLDVRLMIAEAAAQRARSLAALEALAGVDAEMFEQAATATVPPGQDESVVHP